MLALKSAINAVINSNIEAAPISVSALAVLRSKKLRVSGLIGAEKWSRCGSSDVAALSSTV
jgi:hypothetical protein